eukprot:gb/GECH01012617.1/.p1 GENE.gb/GECH01012617.1/~~gb/GECH01012617.1/.p1  ORF type:complete len:115 (+),score=43.06 gb/GECH01012617.1/:1-345(+)
MNQENENNFQLGQSNETEQNNNNKSKRVVDTPLKRVHLFIWSIFNIIRNLDLLRQWLILKDGSSSKRAKSIEKQTHLMLSRSSRSFNQKNQNQSTKKQKSTLLDKFENINEENE